MNTLPCKSDKIFTQFKINLTLTDVHGNNKQTRPSIQIAKHLPVRK